MIRWEKRAQNAKHPWRVGDLCQAIYGDVGEGMIYRVVDVVPDTRRSLDDVSLKLEPVFGVLTDITGRRPRSLGSGYCTPVSLIDLATEYAKFGLFIANEARKRAGTDAGQHESPADAAEVPAGDARDVEDGPADADGGGLCADYSARAERQGD